MIYKMTPPITLYGEAADDFLESVGVELYEKHVVIGEDAYLGADGEAILNENGVYLYEDCIVLEGQQAEEYKARKAKEKEDESQKYKQQAVRRYPSPANCWETNYGDKHKKNPTQYKDKLDAFDGDKDAMKRWGKRYCSDSRRMGDAANIANKDYYSGKRKRNTEENARAIDATNRHMRRHPKQYAKKYNESTIFKSIDLI